MRDSVCGNGSGPTGRKTSIGVFVALGNVYNTGCVTCLQCSAFLLSVDVLK